MMARIQYSNILPDKFLLKCIYVQGTSLHTLPERIYNPTDYGHPERAFFQKFEIFGLGQTNWAENLWGIWAISGQTISTILALWVPYPWESVAGPLSYKKLWFLGLKHITPKCSQNKILAVKNSGNSVHTSVFGGVAHTVGLFGIWIVYILVLIHTVYPIIHIAVLTWLNCFYWIVFCQQSSIIWLLCNH